MKGTDIYVDNILGEHVRQLFINVILRAVKDAFYTKHTETTLLQKDQAMHWLCDGSDDFYEVCTYAGLDGNSVRRKCQFLSKMRADRKNRILKKICSSNTSLEEKNSLMLDSLAYKQEFLFLEMTQGQGEKPAILNKAFDLCEKGYISMRINRKGNKIQYFATGERV